MGEFYPQPRKVCGRSAAGHSFKTNAVPIENLAQAAGINSKPLASEPNPLVRTIDQGWLNN
jgi:hypothetical protein